MKISKLLLAGLMSFSLLALGNTPVQAALTDLSCDYFARQNFPISQVTPGQILSAPDCKFPTGTTFTYNWFVSGTIQSNSATYTVPDRLGAKIELMIYASHPGYNTTSIRFIGTILCKLSPFSISTDRTYLTPKSPLTITATSADPNVTFTYSRDSNPQLTVTPISRGVWKLEISSAYSAFGRSDSFRVTQSKPNCMADAQNLNLPLGYQLGPVVFGPLSGDVLRVGTPIGLKRLAAPSTTTVRYEWEVGGKIYTTPTYTPTQTDLGQRIWLVLKVDDASAGWSPGWVSVDYEFGSGATISASLSLPSPTPISTAIPSPIASAPSTNPGNQGGSAPTPVISPTQSPKPSQSSSPSSAPAKTQAPSVTTAPKVANAYTSCSALRKVFVNGVARDAAAIKRYSLKTKPVLQNAVYKANIKLDTDKDGLACER